MPTATMEPIYRARPTLRFAGSPDERASDLVQTMVMSEAEGLVRAGAEVITARRAWIGSRGDAFGEYYQRVSGGLAARMTYRSSVTLPEKTSLEAVAGAFSEALVAAGERERRMGVTVVGRHSAPARVEGLGAGSSGLRIGWTASHGCARAPTGRSPDDSRSAQSPTAHPARRCLRGAGRGTE